MKSRFQATELLVLVVIVLPFLYLLKVYGTLPSKVPTHFGMDGQPNDYSNKSFLWVLLSLMAVMSLLIYLLMRFLPRIDPKKKAKYSAGVFNKIGVAIVLLLCLINCFVIRSAQTGEAGLGGFLPVVLGIFFTFLGNIMHSIKPNYFAGIRTPWTLESEETWRKTHQFGGKLWFAGGVVLAITGLFLSSRVEQYVMALILTVMVVWPIVYSYRFFKSIEKK